jgi:hypothetical protein
MPFTVVALLFLATAPIHMLPAILAAFSRCRGWGWLVAANLAIWLGFPLSNAVRLPLQLGLAGALVLWLLLLRVALSATDRHIRESES